jgi:SAM-dependent methyltransferase
MMQRIRSLLAHPKAYQLFFNLIGANERSRVLVREYIRPRPGDRILEIGCGPATIVPYLPSVEYFGFDASPEYIAQARSRFPDANFICERVSQYTLPHREYFNIVLALGIVHHLDDEEALQLFRISRDALKSGGKLVTLDGVWTHDQSRMSRYVQARDRGRFIREEGVYVNLAKLQFAKVESHVRHDLLRIPYSHLIMECTR